MCICVCAQWDRNVKTASHDGKITGRMAGSKNSIEGAYESGSADDVSIFANISLFITIADDNSRRTMGETHANTVGWTMIFCACESFARALQARQSSAARQSARLCMRVGSVIHCIRAAEWNGSGTLSCERDVWMNTM